MTQTDTTIGFVSQNADRLTTLKQRPPYKHYIKALPSLQQLTSFVRVPQKQKNLLRRAKQTTFIFPSGDSYRIIKERRHLLLIQKLGWVYTTSANLSGEEFDEKFASDGADVIIGYPNHKENNSASTVLKINSVRERRLR
ncbi:MAG: Sua5 YciO YrdC YwlC family protein [Campylobacterota bacterium]|nr:Sua5 YciO YrdC YwlC family protein [Campylobacterota bacterium]